MTFGQNGKASRDAKSILGTAVFLILFVFLTPSESEAKPANPPSFDALAKDLHTPELLEKYMRKNFIYITDRALFGQEEYWQTPEEMAFRKEGDCEDFAGFAQAVLQRNGYRAFLFSVYWNNDAHTIVVFEKEGVWGYFDLDHLRYLKENSLRELGDKIKRHWSYLGLMRREGKIGLVSRKFTPERVAQASLSLL